jgi:hypothetical protein
VDRALRLSLYDLRPRQDLIAVRDIADSQTDKITTTQFAVDCKVEQGKITDSMSVLKVDPDGPDVFRPQRRLLPDQPALVPCVTGLFGFISVSHSDDGSSIVVSGFDAHAGPIGPSFIPGRPSIACPRSYEAFTRAAGPQPNAAQRPTGKFRAKTMFVRRN